MGKRYCDDLDCEGQPGCRCIKPEYRKRSNDSLCDEFRSIINLAAKMLERDDKPARTEVAKDLRSSAGVIMEKLRAI